MVVKPFRNALRFAGDLTDSRGVTATITAQIRDNGHRIIGVWKDDLGDSGIFSLGKTPPASKPEEE